MNTTTEENGIVTTRNDIMSAMKTIPQGPYRIRRTLKSAGRQNSKWEIVISPSDGNGVICKFNDSEQGEANAQYVLGAMNSQWKVIARVARHYDSANDQSDRMAGENEGGPK